MKKEVTNPVLKGETIGHPVSVSLSTDLRRYISSRDRQTVSVKSGIGPSTVRNLMYGETTITETNLIAVIELIKLARERARKEVIEGRKVENRLKKILT